MPLKRDDTERILGRLDTSGECWEWTGALTGPNRTSTGGYGKSFVGQRNAGTYRDVLVHRFVYEALVGPIPPGLDLDHLCRNRKCANPEHLEPVTRGENIRRGLTGTVPAWNRHHPRPNRVKKFCKYGHDKSDAIIYKSGSRGCRTCRRIYDESRKRRAA
jgi:hypothetical protein